MRTIAATQAWISNNTQTSYSYAMKCYCAVLPDHPSGLMDRNVLAVQCEIQGHDVI